MGSTHTMTLTDFLLARIAEDEEAARSATQGRWAWDEKSTDSWPTGDQNLSAHGDGDDPEPVVSSWGYDADGIDADDADREHIVTWQPARVLAECEAKRRIVDRHRCCDVHGDCDACLACGDGSPWPCDDALALASVYADHPDFRDEWRG